MGWVCLRKWPNVVGHRGLTIVSAINANDYVQKHVVIWTWSGLSFSFALSFTKPYTNFIHSHLISFLILLINTRWLTYHWPPTTITLTFSTKQSSSETFGNLLFKRSLTTSNRTHSIENSWTLHIVTVIGFMFIIDFCRWRNIFNNSSSS